MSFLLERREELEQGVASDKALADSPLLESPARREETYKCGEKEKEEVKVEDTKMWRSHEFITEKQKATKKIIRNKRRNYLPKNKEKL